MLVICATYPTLWVISCQPIESPNLSLGLHLAYAFTVLYFAAGTTHADPNACIMLI